MIESVHKNPDVTHIFCFRGIYFMHFRGKTKVLLEAPISELEDIRDDLTGPSTVTKVVFEEASRFKKMMKMIHLRIDGAPNLAKRKRESE